MAVYLDNAATTWPKPASVQQAMVDYMTRIGANPGRSGHRLSVEAERLRFDTREVLAHLFGLRNPMRVVFTLNATAAINLVIRGMLANGDHVITSSMEHNSVMRPIRSAEVRGVKVSVAQCDQSGRLDPQRVAELIKPDTKLIVCTHASNVCGTILPIREIGAIAKQANVPFLVDAAQTAGCLPINMSKDNIDLLAFTGHKGLLGPSGTGGLAINDSFDIDLLPATTFGGTGSRSEKEIHPDFLPDKYESGTPNIVGLAGLLAGVKFVQYMNVSEIGRRERYHAQRLLDQLSSMPKVRVVGPGKVEDQTAVVSFVVDGTPCSQLAQRLDEEYGIMCRPGLHCAPSAHRTLGTFDEGTVRFAPGLFTENHEIDRAAKAVMEIVEKGN